MEKPLKTAWVSLKVGWGRASGNHQGGENCDSQVDGVSDMAPAYCFCGARAQKKNNAYASIAVWDKTAP